MLSRNTDLQQKYFEIIVDFRTLYNVRLQFLMAVIVLNRVVIFECKNRHAIGRIFI